MHEIDWSKDDIRQIDAEGLTLEEVRSQIERFHRGARPVLLHRPCTAGDGIVVIPEGERDALVRLYEESLGETVAVKFVPASGAATRMFREWYRYLDEPAIASNDARLSFVSDLPRFAFFPDLREVISRTGGDLTALLANAKIAEILTFILTPEGLNYGQLPKALLKFHGYPERSRTALEEHLVEAALYARDVHAICRAHFTVSGEHLRVVEDCLSQVRAGYEDRHGVRFDIALSIQESSTNTVAADARNRPIRDREGRLLFRPGGHGALLAKLNRIDGDVIFVKNIDNVVPDRLKAATIHSKKTLGGYLLSLQKEMFRYLHALDSGLADEPLVRAMTLFCRKKLSVGFPRDFDDHPLAERRRYLSERMNRPLRVCGMVRNEGEPGGGPFWVEEADGTQSLQIVEEIEIDRRSEGQQAIWRAATHFNPVDLVCAVRGYRGQKFDLRRFVNRMAFCIAEKSEKGRELRALELPGLWNGSMAFWNTAFVEVPIETFNPVKTVTDLLRPAHLPV